MHRSIRFRERYHKPDTENHPAEKRSTFFKEGTMPLKVEAGSDYGSMIGSGLAVNLGASETLPLLIPEDEPELNYFKPLSRAELEAAAGGPGWKKFRSRLVLLFWLGWLTILGIAITVIIQSPRPVAPHLPWWQKELFYRLQPALFMDADSTESGAISRVSEKLPYLKSLGVGVMILEGLFSPEIFLINMTQIDPRLGTLPEFHQFITNSHTAGMRVILDLCNNKAEILSNASDYVQDSLRYWLEQGVSGFQICDAEPAFTEKTLQTWIEMVKEFITGGNERIMMVREISDSVSGLNISESAINSSMVELVSRSLIPPSSHPLSASEIAEAIESMLKTLHRERPSWRVDGPIAWNLQKVLMVLMMTLPGTPVISYGEEISQASNPHQPMNSTTLFHSLSHTRSHEEALLYGSFTFLSFNTTSLRFDSTNSTNSSAMPPLAFLRSWGCVHFLVLFNLGSESHDLDYNWTLSLPESGMVVTSTGLDRAGQVSLQSIKLQPHEAIVIKLFETDPDF